MEVQALIYVALQSCRHTEARRNVFMDVVSNVLFVEVPSFFFSKRGMPESVVMEEAIMCLSRTRPQAGTLELFLDGGDEVPPD